MHPDRASARRGVLLPLQPLSRRIPLMMTGVLVIVIGAMLWLGYRIVYDSVVTAELSRLQTASTQLTTSLQASTRRLQRENVRMAALPEMARAVSQFATAADQAAAHRVLAAERARTQQIRAVALWSANGKLLLVEGTLQAAERNPPRLIESQPIRSPEGAEIGSLSARGDTVIYGVFSPIKGIGGATVGYLVVTRRISSSAESAALLGGLVGKNAKLLLGNVAGDFWTDMAVPVTGPPGPVTVGSTGEYSDARGVRHLFASTALPETPWQAMAVMQREEAVAAAKSFVWRMLALAALFIIGGAILTWTIIGRALRPLREVTGAAEGLAGGDYSRRVQIHGNDELGRLGQSFNAMAAKVEDAAADVAARARMLEESNRDLHDSEQRYRDLVEHSPDGVLVSRDAVIIFANPAATRALGFTDAAKLVGRSILDIVQPEDRQGVAERIEKVQREGITTPTRELKLNREDKKTATIEVTSMPLVVDGRGAVQTILHDVTEHRVLEEQLRQAQKMDAVGRLAGGIAHDFNNLLTVIQAHAEFALADDTPELRRADIDEIRRASDSAARLTRQLLTFSRKQVIVPAHIDLNVAISGMLGMLTRLIGDDIQVVTVEGDGLAGIWADPGQLEQVLLNLAINARDAMPDGGMLRFETANVNIGEGYGGASGNLIPAGQYVMLAVQDTGVGMTEEVRAHVFEPFFTTKQPGRGTGLGLSTVYGIVRQSEGHIWVYSEVGRGTTFKIFLPPHDRALHPPVPRLTGEHRIPALSAHILVVEDEPSVRAAIRRALTHAKFTVVEAKDSAEASSVLAADDSIELVITDMVMPGKSGAELVAEIAVSHPTMPVVIMSGYSEETASRQWRVPDNASFIEKPVSPKALVEIVERLLNGGRG